jgi:hypothetical protein
MNTPPDAVAQLIASLGLNPQFAEGGAVVSPDVAAQLVALMGFAAGGPVPAAQPAEEMSEHDMLMKLLGFNYYDMANEGIFNEREAVPVQPFPYATKG